METFAKENFSLFNKLGHRDILQKCIRVAKCNWIYFLNRLFSLGNRYYLIILAIIARCTLQLGSSSVNENNDPFGYTFVWLAPDFRFSKTLVVADTAKIN